MNQKKTVLYAHAGSGNHGCEALANTICKMIDNPVLLITNSVEEDRKYSLKELCEIVPEQNICKNKLVHILYYGWRMITKDRESFLRYRFKYVIGKKSCLWNISIGGDNYCYPSMVEDLILTNRVFHRNGGKTVLLGCSIEPELLEQEAVKEDMNLYDAVFARESLTYEALKKAGIRKSYLYPDSAFFLETKKLPLPTGFLEGNTVGINISPMIVENERQNGITMRNYKALVEEILGKTGMNVALIPHVVWDRNDDRRTLKELYVPFKENERVVMISDCGAEELKGYIARCRFFIGARTHATIAAYSSQVPTLVVGYSVKAKGIAKDLFGTFENYVKPVQELETSEQLKEAFYWIYEREEEIRQHLERIMPNYIEKAREAGVKLKEIMGQKPR